MEDFVPFEIAKKLKEKGFSLNKEDIEFIGCRLIFSDECTIKRISTIGAYNKEYFGENIDCPTIQQVLKWLREKEISVEPISTLYNCWDCHIKNKGELETIINNDKYKTYENAALAGIECVLDNLI